MKKATRPEQGLGLTYAGGRPRDEDVLTRRRLSFWDRSKWLVLLVVIWLLLVWSLMANNPLTGFGDAVKIETRIGWWVFILIGLELIHQLHFFISERFRRLQPVLGQEGMGQVGAVQRPQDLGVGRSSGSAGSSAGSSSSPSSRSSRARSSTRHQLSALLRIPQIVWSAMPFVVQIVFTLFFVVAQFGMLFLVPVQGRCRRLLPPTTSRPGSPTSGARTTCSSGSRRTSSSLRTPS